jgi:hypothetical protein
MGNNRQMELYSLGVLTITDKWSCITMSE